MATHELKRDPADLLPNRQTLLVLGALVLAEFLAVVWYFVLTDATPGDLRYLAYPFVWINVGLVAAWRTRLAPASDRTRTVAAVLAAGYLGLLGYFGGLVAPGTLFAGGSAFGPSLHFVAPGWGPALFYRGELLHVSILPFKLVGYLALAYLVYATVLDAAGAAVTGVLGLLSCVSCSWPILASIATGFFGASGAATTAALSASYDLSTVVFVATVALLYWRPFGR